MSSCLAAVAGVLAVSAAPTLKTKGAAVKAQPILKMGSLARVADPWLLPLGATDVCPVQQGLHRGHHY